MIPRGEWNVLEGFFGVPGTGKSTLALSTAIELSKRSYVLAHDPGWRLPSRLPDGRASGIVRHDSVAQARTALATNPRGVHSVACVDAGEVVALARAVASASLQQNGGARGWPVTVLIDEVVSARDAGVYRLGEDLRQLVALRRHLHVGLLFTTQSPRLCHNQLLSQATALHAFRLHDGRDHRKLLDVGFTVEELAKIRNLPNYQYVTKRLS